MLSNISIRPTVALDYKLVLALGVVIAAAVYLKKNPNALNVASPDNIANRAAEGLYKNLTGSEQGPGADLYDYLHRNDPEPLGWRGGVFVGIVTDIYGNKTTAPDIYGDFEPDGPVIVTGGF